MRPSAPSLRGSFSAGNLSNETLNMDYSDYPKQKIIVAIDSGTQSTRCLVYAEDTLIKVSTSSKFSNILECVQDGWSEHNVADIEEALVGSMVEALAKFDTDTHEIVGLGITNQRESIVAWDAVTGQLLREKSICWNDMRTSQDIEILLQTWTQDDIAYLKERTGLKIASYYSASKMRWLLNNDNNVMRAAKQGRLRFGTIDSFLVYRLTNGQSHVTDVTNASRTLLFDIHALQWDPKLLSLWEIPLESLPRVQASCSLFGSLPEDFTTFKTNVSKAGFEKLPSILQGAKITGVIGDQQGATIGHALFQEGGTKLTFGSGGFMLMNCGYRPPTPIPDGLTVSPLMHVEGEAAALYCVEGSIAVAGMGISWMKNTGILSIDELESMVKTTLSSEGVIFMPSFTGLLSPWWNEDIKATISGLTLKSERKHIVRAFLEALAVQVDEILRAMTAACAVSPLVYLDGGLSQSDEFLQIISDFTGATLYRPPDCEMTARGAAICAAIGCTATSKTKKLKEIEKSAKEWEHGVTSLSYRFEPSLRLREKSYAAKVKEEWLELYNTMAAHYDRHRTQ